FWLVCRCAVMARAPQEGARGSRSGLGSLYHAGLSKDKRSEKRRCHIVAGHCCEDLTGWCAASDVKPHIAHCLSGNASKFPKRSKGGWPCCWWVSRVQKI